MDFATAENQFKGIGDVEQPREIDVVLSNGVCGTIAIPHAVDHDDFLELGYAPPTNRMAIILHGQGGHRNYCYQKMVAHKLAAELGVYSFRIDFRGCGDLADVADPKVGRVLQLDVEDLQQAAEFAIDARKNPLGRDFVLSAIISHSRGSLAMFLWAVGQQKLLDSPGSASKAIFVPNLINCSLRYRSKTVLDRYPVKDTDFEFVNQRCFRHGKIQDVPITRTELYSLYDLDPTQFENLSPFWSVMSIYGNRDTIVPREDCAFYANAFNRGPYTHHLEIIDHADHNFYGENPVENEADAEDYNPHGLPLNKRKLVNYNYVVSALIVKYLLPDQELLRFEALTRLIGGDRRVKKVDGISNFRDLGGWPIVNSPLHSNNFTSRFVKPNYFYRCANPARVSKDGLEAMRALNVKSIFDLRSEQECEKDGIPQRLSEFGIERVHAPVFRHQDYSPEATALRLTNLITSWHTYIHVYEQVLENGADLFRVMFEHIRDYPDRPMLFHCTAGKDRTGVFGMLVLLLAGVDKSTIASEYALTTFGLRPDHEVIKQTYLAGVQKLRAKEGADQMESLISRGRKNWSVEEDGFNNLISSRTDAMLATIELLNVEYGGVVKYLTDFLGFSMEDVEKIHSNIVSTVPPTASMSEIAKF